MPAEDIQPARIQRLNDRPARGGDYVLYWMQQSQRAHWNHALEFAIDEANARGLPVLACFGLMDDYPEANLRHTTFLLEGLAETQRALAERGIPLALHHGAPAAVALRLAEKAALLVCDRGYLRHQKAWRAEVAAAAPCAVVQVESDVIVPVEVASPKAEYAARTLRPKILRHFLDFLVPVRARVLKKQLDRAPGENLDLGDIAALCARLKLDRSVAPVSALYRGGEREARRIFRAFLRERFGSYAENRNQPQTDDCSHMSRHLHFGQVSPLWLALEARATGAMSRDAQTFIEELLVRRELSMNFVHYTPNYDRYEALPNWAQKTLAIHARDPRPHCYTRAQLEAGATHDPYWNAAMREMRATGFMHNYMRMYWGKKILEWSATPEEAHATALAINNKFFLDGRDAISFANVAWLFGLHDRPWGEREIFGQVRYMNAAGLERKCDIKAYVAKTARLAARVVNS